MLQPRLGFSEDIVVLPILQKTHSGLNKINHFHKLKTINDSLGVLNSQLFFKIKEKIVCSD